MKYIVTLNDRVYEVEVEEGEAMLADEYEAKAPAAAPALAAVSAAPAPVPSVPAAPAAAGNGTAVTAPMPGNILKINVAAGQKVNEGDVLIVLEAMKMENEVVATKSGTVSSVAVTKGQVVETGTPLVYIA